VLGITKLFLFFAAPTGDLGFLPGELLEGFVLAGDFLDSFRRLTDPLDPFILFSCILFFCLLFLPLK
jgi:hypothetical protein